MTAHEAILQACTQRVNEAFAAGAESRDSDVYLSRQQIKDAYAAGAASRDAEIENFKAYAKHERSLGAEPFAIENNDLRQQLAAMHERALDNESAAAEAEALVPVLQAEIESLRADAFAWWCVESDCITRSTHCRDNWASNGKTLVPLYK